MSQAHRLFLVVLVGGAALSTAHASGATELERAAVQKLRTHCNACHGLGKLRFLWSQDDDAVWHYLLTAQAPVSRKIWAEGIIEVLDWPGGKMPAFDTTLPSGKDWMPKGIKRVDLATDRLNGRDAREEVLALLRFALSETPGVAD